MFDALRRDVCVRLDDNNNNVYVIRVGIIGQIDYLTELFRKKHVEETKTVPRHRSTPSSTSTPTLTQSIVTSASASLSNSTPSDTDTAVRRSSTFDYRSNIVSSINKWAISETKSGGSSRLKLVEGTDYTLEFSSSTDTIVIVCQCSTRLSFSRSTDNGFSLSNLYKHWKTSKRCNVMIPNISGHESTAPSSPSSTNDSLANDLDNCDDQEEENYNDESSHFTTSLIRPNTRSSNKRTILHSLATSNQPSAK